MENKKLERVVLRVTRERVIRVTVIGALLFQDEDSEISKGINPVLFVLSQFLYDLKKNKYINDPKKGAHHLALFFKDKNFEKNLVEFRKEYEKMVASIDFTDSDTFSEIDLSTS